MYVIFLQDIMLFLLTIKRLIRETKTQMAHEKSLNTP